MAAHRRAPAATRRRAPDPHAARRRRARARTSRACSASATGPARRRSTQLDAEHQRHQAIVRSIHEKLFFAPLLDTLAGVGALSMEAAQERLTAFGFRDIEQTRAALEELTAGPHPPVARDAAAAARDARLAVGRARPRPRPARAPAPDRGLQPQLDARPPVPRLAARRRAHVPHPRLVTRARRRALPPARLRRRARRRRDARRPRRRAPSSSTRRSTRSTGARTTPAADPACAASSAGTCSASARATCSGSRTLDAAGRELSRLADACVEAALRSLEPTLPFAVIGLGRLGGAELSYASDIDVIFVYDGTTAADFATAERTATRLVRRDRRQHVGGPHVPGRHPAAARRQPGPARAVARRLPRRTSSSGRRRGSSRRSPRRGSSPATPTLGERFVAARARVRVPRSVPRGVAARGAAHEGAHRERAHPARRRPAVPPQARPRARCPTSSSRCSSSSSRTAARTPRCASRRRCGRSPRSSAIGAISDRRRRAAARSRSCCASGRATTATSSPGSPSDALPVDGDEAEKLARMLGYTHRPQQSLRDDYRRVTRRARAIVERIFYARDD